MVQRAYSVNPVQTFLSASGVSNLCVSFSGGARLCPSDAFLVQPNLLILSYFSMKTYVVVLITALLF